MTALATHAPPWKQPRQNCAKGFSQLNPIPSLDFYPTEHRYKFQNQLVAHSVSKVAKGLKPDDYFRDTEQLPVDHPERINLKAAIERGNFCHGQMENYFRGVPVDFGEYQQWIESCLKEPFWAKWEAVPGGIETSLIDTRYSIAGKCDVVLRNRESGEISVLDFKTQSKKSSQAYCVRSQLGGYISLLDQCYPGLGIQRAFACFMRPGDTEIVPYDAYECLAKWETNRDCYMKVRSVF